MRLLAYTDYLYRDVGGTIFGERAFVRFLGGLAREVGGLRLLGRLDRSPGRAHYALDQEIEFVALPHYARLTDIGAFLRTLPRTLACMWRQLDDTDVVFTLGPHPPALALAALGLVRRRRVVLGVRQDFPAYVGHRHPHKLHLRLVARFLETVWRGLALLTPVVVVGPDLAQSYRHSRRLLEITVSLVTAGDVEAGARAAGRSYAADALTLLSVGRLDAEKNPLLLIDVLGRLREQDRRFKLVVCGEGDLERELRARIDELGLLDSCEVRGFVPLHEGLLDLYRDSHVFLHVSRTEGLPQVLVEAYASGLPSVATAVGGVRSLGDCSLLIDPDDAPAAAAAVRRLVDDRSLRERLIATGLERARRTTLEAQTGALARFIAD